MFTYENGSIVLFALVMVMITVAPFVFEAIVVLVIPEVMALMLVIIIIILTNSLDYVSKLSSYKFRGLRLVFYLVL